MSVEAKPIPAACLDASEVISTKVKLGNNLVSAVVYISQMLLRRGH